MTVPIPFQLQPFGGAATRSALALEALALEGELALERSPQGARLRIRLGLRQPPPPRGPAAVVLPPPQASPSRRDGLWQHTCLEAFVAATGTPAYWELNLAPSGDWAIYRFADYRSGQVSPELEPPPFSLERGPGTLALNLGWPLPPELSGAAGLEVGISAVLEQQSGALSYWALHHPAAEADFHRREGFRLRL